MRVPAPTELPDDACIWFYGGTPPAGDEELPCDQKFATSNLSGSAPIYAFTRRPDATPLPAP